MARSYPEAPSKIHLLVLEELTKGRILSYTWGMTQVLANSKGPGAKPLGSHAGNVSGAFHEGHHFDTPGGGSRATTGKNFANAGYPKHGGASLNFGNKDGQRQAGTPKLSGATKGPRGRSTTSKKVSGKS